ncbi:aldo/keto reductase [Actinokineospora xionganensis]|uniref:Aldo/keto reductase n=1 Tax=Actinokineospora xionganensis TaxID=2684470 RepID=A0ABR7L0K6_9PSEU|nr:aldo/keto reductase [Actinokineospora xionganensis]MBC6446013.1 aldo/keto reductase [Actinokineospora xionganensis]
MRYSLLGRTGLKVSVLSLGAASLGSRWGQRWTMSRPAAEHLVGAALDHGINHFDTANVYNMGESEEWLGAILHGLSARERCVVSTKFGYRTSPDDPNSGGAGRKNMYTSVERSLRRLRTDYLDVLYLHLWDRVTPVEETLEAASDLVRSGKIRHFGLSNVPGWYLGAADAMGRNTGMTTPAAVQLNYNLLTRAAEPEFLSFQRYSGIGLVAWGPLANGLLSGRYTIDAAGRRISGGGRLTETFTTGDVDPFNPVVSRVLRCLTALAARLGHPPASIALAWLLRKPEVTSVLMGVSTIEQLNENLAATEVPLDDEALTEIDQASLEPPVHPYPFLTDELQELVHGNDNQKGE